MLNYGKFISILVLISLIIGCTNENSVSNHETQEKIDLLECEHSEFQEIFKKMREILPTFFPDCSDFEVSYREFSNQEENNIVLFSEELMASYLSDFNLIDTSDFFKEFAFTSLSSCSPTIDYNIKNECAFYSGGIYHNSDFSLQYFRLIQEGVEEKMDLFIWFNGDEIEVISMG